MPSLLDTPSRTETIVSGVATLIARGGMAAVTMRSIATETGVPVSSLTHHLGGRDHLLQVSCHEFGLRMVKRIDARSRRDSVCAFVPSTPDELQDIRVWLAFCDLGRSHEGVAHAAERVRGKEAWLLVNLLEPNVDDSQLFSILALVDGLRAAVTARVEPMPLTAACQTLAAFCERVVPCCRSPVVMSPRCLLALIERSINGKATQPFLFERSINRR